MALFIPSPCRDPEPVASDKIRSMKYTIKLFALTAMLGFGTAGASLVSHYTFDETAGTTATDSGPAGANGTIGSNVTLGAPGKFGTAFTFNNDVSQNGIVDMGNAATFTAINASQALTVSVWLKWSPTADNRDCAVFLGSDSAATRYIDVGSTTAGGVYGRTRDAANTTTPFPDLVRGMGLNDGQWHHVAYTTNATTDVTQIYVDGTFLGTTTTPVFTFPAFNNLEIGRLGRGTPADAFSGSVDELRIYDTVLSAGEITSLAGRDPVLGIEDTFSFSNSGLPQTLTIPFSNQGLTNNLVLTAPNPITFVGGDTSLFSVLSYDNNLAPGASGSIRLNFTPNAGGTAAVTVAIASNDPFTPTREVTVSVAVADPVAVIEQTAVDFGTFATPPSPQVKTVSIKNNGAANDLQIFDLLFSGSPVFSTSQTLPVVVSPGATINIPVTFNPAGADGSFTGNVEIVTDSNPTSVFNLPLTAEVKLVNPGAALVSLFTFDDQSNVGKDTGSLQNDGTPQGDAKWTATSRVGTGALLLDGVGDLVDLGTGTGPDYTTNLVSDNDGFTVACWAQVPTTATQDRVRIFSSYANGATTLAEGWGVGRRNTARNLVATAYGRVDYLGAGNSAPPAGDWHHYAYVFRNSPFNRVDFYIDGLLVGSQTAVNTGMNDAATVGFAIGALGRSNAFEGFNGLLDDLRIYSRELTSGNIADLYSSVPSTSPYATWASGFGLNPATTGAYAQDPDHDGLSNSLEYLLGSSPISGASAGQYSSSKTTGGLTVVYRRSIAARTAGFADQVEYSETLAAGSWTTAVHNTGGVTITTAPVDAGTEEVTVTIPSSSTKKFARLKVVAP